MVFNMVANIISDQIPTAVIAIRFLIFKENIVFRYEMSSTWMNSHRYYCAKYQIK